VLIKNWPGLFITYEGGEGCGKTTQIKLFKEYLESEGNEVVLTREPGGCPLADKIRAMLLDPDHTNMSNKTEFFLFMAGRAQHVQEVIAPALAAGKTVLCDRYYDSTAVYQVHTRHTVSPKEFEYSNSLAITHEGKLYRPNITFMLDIDVTIGHGRALARNTYLKDSSEARIDNEHIEFHTRVNEGYRKIAEDPDNVDRIIRIDANASIEEVQTKLQHKFQTEVIGEHYRPCSNSRELFTVGM
jgi:dTMP kinase